MMKKKVLLVDDVNFFLEQEKSLFQGSSLELLLARNGNDALDLIKREKPDLVFLDLYMPGMDGDQCCLLVKSDKELQDIPIIMVTKGVDDMDFERCWQAGCNDIVSKPINRHYFLAVAYKYLNLNRRKDQRFVARLCIRYGTDSQKILSGYTVNLSTGGVFIETDKPLPVYTPLNIEFILAGKSAPIHCKGRVSWINSPDFITHQNLPAGMGIQFLDITLDEMGILRTYIKEEALLPSW